MGVSSTKAPVRGGGTSSGRRNAWPSFKRDPILVPIPFLEPGQSTSPAILGRPVLEAIITAFSTEVEELVAETKKICKKLFHLAQEVEDAEKQRDRMCNCVLDLKDQKYDVQREIWKLEQDLNGKKEELAQLEARKKELEASGLKGPIVTPSVLGLSQGGASTEPRAQKKNKGKQKPKETPWPSLTRGTGVLQVIFSTLIVLALCGAYSSQHLVLVLCTCLHT